MRHPGEVLWQGGSTPALPACDHYCGVEPRIRKSLALQRAMSDASGACLFDVTLDCEDGAPVGAERAHAEMVADLLLQARSEAPAGAVACRRAVRVHPVDHPAFAEDVAVVVGRCGPILSHLMLPKVDARADVDRALSVIDPVAVLAGRRKPLPVHVLIESAASVEAVGSIAAHPRVESLSFGLMDFVSSHGGAIPASAMAVHPPGVPQPPGADPDQFGHPLVLRAKLAIAAAAHACGKVPAHGVVTEYRDAQALRHAARQACRTLGYTRMWSIHPDQIAVIVDAFAPDQAAIAQAADILAGAAAADWAPISHGGKLHDRASYRYFWHVLVRAHRTGQDLPVPARAWCQALAAAPEEA